MSVATTGGVRVEVTTQYVAERSSPKDGQFFFAYTVRVSNESTVAVQLMSRHWVITDSRGRVENVRGPGVVGQQPVLEPGDSFVYTSACPLSTPYGTMQGSYQMVRADGTRFDATIAAFDLAAPTESPSRWLN